MSARLINERGVRPVAFDGPGVQELLAAGFFWVDVEAPDEEQYRSLEQLGIHDLVLEDARHFGQRPKLEEYDDYVVLVLYGVDSGDDPLVEVHCLWSERFLITLHRWDCPALAVAREGHGHRREGVSAGATAVHRVADALVDSFLPLLESLGDRIDELEMALLESPEEAELREVYAIRRRLVDLRKVVGPERDLLSRLLADAAALPGVSVEAERRFRDVYDHVIRVETLIDSHREVVSGAMEAYHLGAAARLNQVMKQLTLIATIFLPLTFLIGFFGQNFAWMVRELSSQWAFWVIGVGSELVVVAALLALFRRRGWL